MPTLIIKGKIRKGYDHWLPLTAQKICETLNNQNHIPWSGFKRTRYYTCGNAYTIYGSSSDPYGE